MDDPRPANPIAARHSGREPHLLREVMRTHHALMSGFSRGVGMPASRFALMRLLANSAESGVGVMDLARELGVNAAAVTRQVKEMEAEGLVLRRSDASDGRRSYVRLSASGLRSFEAIHRRSHQLEDTLCDVIGADQMAAAASVLVKVQTVIQELSRQGSAGVRGIIRRQGSRS